MKKRVVCFLFTLVLCAFALPMGVFAADGSGCLCFTAEEAKSAFNSEKFEDPTMVSVSYFTHGTNWGILLPEDCDGGNFVFSDIEYAPGKTVLLSSFDEEGVGDSA